MAVKKYWLARYNGKKTNIGVLSKSKFFVNKNENEKGIASKYYEWGIEYGPET